MKHLVPGGYDSLKKHCGHKLDCKEEDGSVMIECLDCKKVIIAFDKPVISTRPFRSALKNQIAGSDGLSSKFKKGGAKE